MKQAFRLGRLAVASALWFVLAVGGVQEGAEWIGGLYLQRAVSGTGALRVRLLKMKVRSAAGSLQAGGQTLSWNDAEWTPRAGLRVTTLTYGDPNAPLAVIRGLHVRSAGASREVSIGRLVLGGEARAWGDLIRAVREGPKRRGPSAPMELVVNRLSVRVLEEEWTGGASLRLNPGAGEGALSVSLSATKGELSLSAGWSQGTGRGSISLGGEEYGWGRGAVSWEEGVFQAKADLSFDGNRIGVDGRGRLEGEADFLLWTLDQKRGFSSIAVALNTGGLARGKEITVGISQGILRVPALSFPGSWRVDGLEIAVDYFLTSTLQREKAGCVQVIAGGRVIPPVERIQRAFEANFTYLPGPMGSAEAWAFFGPRRRSKGEKFDSRSFFQAGVRGLKGSERTFYGRLDSGGMALTLQGETRGKKGNAEGTVRAGPGEVAWRGGWNGDAWRLSGSVEIHPSNPLKNNDYPLPQGPLSGLFQARGRGMDVGLARADVKGRGSWKLLFEEGKGLLSVKDGGLLFRGGSFHGVSGGVEARGISLSGFPASWSAALGCSEAEIEGERVEEVKARGRGDKQRFDWSLGGNLPKLEARISGRGTASLAPPYRVALTSGRVSLLRGDLSFDGLKGSYSVARERAVWSSESASIFGERMRGITGRVRVKNGGKTIETEASGPHWGGRVEAFLSSGGKGAEKGLRIDGKGVDPAAVKDYIGRWVALPFGLAGGPADVRVFLPLKNLPDGIRFGCFLRKVNMSMQGGDRTIPGVSGNLSGIVSGKGVSGAGRSVTLDGGKIPVELDYEFEGSKGRLRFRTSLAPMESLQEVLFDFLPEYVGYGKMEGRASVVGSLRRDGERVDAAGTLEIEGGLFLSEDKELKIKGVTGSLPFSIHLGEKEGAKLKGYSAPDEETLSTMFATYSSGGDGTRPLVIRKIRYSVFSMEDLAIRPKLEKGTMVLGVSRAKLWEGTVAGEGRLRITGNGIQYAGQLLFHDLSLRAFANQSRALAGALSGPVSGSLTVRAPSLGISRAKGLLDLWVDPGGEEKKRISKDFIVKIGGGRIKLLLTSSVLSYDEARMRCGLDNGLLTFYDLSLRHRANPLKVIRRKDVSFEVKVPRKNSVNLWRLIELVEGLDNSARPAKGE